MEFQFYTSKIFPADAQGFAIIDGKQPMRYRKTGIPKLEFNTQRTSSYFGSQEVNQHSTIDDQFDEVINQMGQASAKAQKLPQVITTSMKLFTSDNRLYIRVEGKKAIGFIKVGQRNLFIRNAGGHIKEIKPLCVLDFYVHESMQRGGHGRALFDLMLQSENITPEKLGYDRPSEKLQGFCAKHFGLKKYVP